MIIGINGEIGSGKDTVAAIIQKLTAESVHNQAIMRKWHNKKFAAKLKQVASIITGIPVEKFEDQEFKKSNLGSDWDRLYSISPSMPLERMPMTVRELLQKLGTEAIRDGLHENTWVNALMSEYTHDTNWVITDMRFPNEYDAVVSRDGLTFKILGRNVNTGGEKHSSETALDNHHFDYIINNNGSLGELEFKVKNILTVEKIL